MKLTLKQLKDLISSYRTALNEAENFERLGLILEVVRCGII